jgi:hypothetical protein
MNRNRLAALLLGVSVLAFAQQPKIVNSQFHTEPVGLGLSATVDRFQHASGPLWLGYEVPALPRTHFSVCSGDASPSMDDGCCGEYRLEDSDNSFRSSDGKPQAETNIDVLLRIDQGAITKIRFVGAGCRLNAGGLPFTWLTGVEPDDSVTYLAGVATAGDTHHRADEALAALANHAIPKATAVLASLASPSNPDWLREKAAFWLGAERGHDGFVALQPLARNDPDPGFRKKLTFDLSINSDPAAIDELIRMAKSDADTEVRGQAIFWVGQKAGKKAVAMLNDAIDNDPEVAIKKKAVFALSQLPKDEAVPQLVHVAQTNRDPAIRKDAIFWLGQTKDPRALQYFEQILEH